MPESKKPGRRAFALSFMITFAIMAVLVGIAVFSLQHNFIKPGGTEPELYIPRKTDKMTILVCGTAEDTKNIIFALIGFYPVEGTMPVTVFPAETLVQKGTVTQTLAEVFQSGGVEATKTCIQETTGVEIDRWVQMDKKAFISVMTELGAVDYKLQEPLVIGGVSFSKGVQKLDGAKAAAIILHRGEDEEIDKASGRAADVIAGIINDRMRALGANEQKFKEVKNLIQTDISLTDFLQRQNAINFVGKLAQSPAYRVTPKGSLNGTGDAYILDKDTVQRLTKEYIQ